MEKKKNNWPLLALCLVAVLGVVGGTFAYFTSSDTFANTFSTKPYKTEVVETFDSPDNWTPGTTTNKTVVVNNPGDVEVAVRVSFTEEWKDSLGVALPLEKDGVRAAIINYSADKATKWTEKTEGGVTYYYYNTKLAKNDSTTSLIQSVTFSPDVTIAADTTCVTDDENHTKTCTTTTKEYGGGTYTLTIKVETVQYDAYQDAWSTDVAIN